MANTSIFSARASLAIAAAAFAACNPLPAGAQDGLTAYERELACQFTPETDCDAAAAAAPARSGRHTVAGERPFVIPKFPTAAPARNGQLATAPAAAQPARGGPKLYTAQGGSTPQRTGAGPRPASAPRTAGVQMRVLFLNDSAELDASDKAELTAWSHVLNTPGNAGKRVRIEGHTNAVGSAAYNDDLSERRAQAVRTFLLGQNVAAERIEAQGFGFSRPATKDPRDARNRRVQIIKVN